MFICIVTGYKLYKAKAIFVQDLQQALSEAYTKLVTNVQDSKGDNTRECEESGRQSICVDGETGTSSNQNQTEAIAKFIQELVKSGVSRSLALEATKHIEVSDVQEGMFQMFLNFVVLANLTCHKCIPVKLLITPYAYHIMQYMLISLV